MRGISTTMPDAPTSSNLPLPMVVITGYLGAGKTTLINGLLGNSNGKRITVLVNDFGEISLDEFLIDNREGDVISLANGCMCCQIGGDLYRTLDKILSLRDGIDLLVVETSGVADPTRISMIAKAEPDLSHRGTLVLIDVVNFLDLLSQAMLRDTLERQIRKADMALLTKCDLASKSSVSETLLQMEEIHPGITVAGSRNEALETLRRDFGTANTSNGVPYSGTLKPHSIPFESWSWQGKEPASREKIEALLSNDELGIYRCKGQLCLDDGSCVTVHKVGDSVTFEPLVRELEVGRLTVVGSRPGFSKQVFQAAWSQTIAACVN